MGYKLLCDGCDVELPVSRALNAAISVRYPGSADKETLYHLCESCLQKMYPTKWKRENQIKPL